MPNENKTNSKNPFLGTLQGIFYLLSFILFVFGVNLIAISLWSLIRKLPYYILLEVKVDIPYFTILAAVLCIPIFWIFISSRWTKKRGYLFHSLITLQVVSISILIAGPNVDFVHVYHENGRTARLTSSLHIQDLNKTLQLSLATYYTSKAVQFAWNNMQQQLKCCGVDKSDDWDISSRGIPSSCCPDENKCHKNTTYCQGCLGQLIRDLIWQKNILKSQCYAGVVVHMGELIVSGVTYISAKQFEK